MQAAPSAKRSPWALRITVVCGGVFLLGLLLISGQASSVMTAFDPRETHELSVEAEGTFLTGTLDDTCYRFYQHEDDRNMAVTLHRIEGSAMVDDPVPTANCSADWQPMASDGSLFIQTSSWVLNGTSEHALVVTCENDCAGEQGYLVSVDRLQNEMFANTPLVLGSMMCCFGLLSTPVALIFYLTSKPNRAPKVMMVNADGQLVPLTHLTPEQTAMMQQQPADSTPQQSVAPPFADTVEAPQKDTFVDGLPDVAAGQMLTTEQVFALMNGDVEAAKEHARSERHQIDSAEVAIKEAANAAAIASWDEGVDLATNPYEPSKPQPASRSPAARANDAGKDQFWKEWDEQ